MTIIEKATKEVKNYKMTKDLTEIEKLCEWCMNVKQKDLLGLMDLFSLAGLKDLSIIQDIYFSYGAL